jgi:hypothetical protein
MFENIIQRLGTNLGLSKEESMDARFVNSKLVKLVCSQLAYGQIIVVNSKHRSIVAAKAMGTEKNNQALCPSHRFGECS